MVRGVIYWHWPDGTLREVKYRDYIARDISPLRLFVIRIRFVWNRIIRLLTHFNSIEVRKCLTSGGDIKYQTRLEYHFDGDGEVIDRKAGHFRRRCRAVNFDSESESRGKRIQSLD